MRSRPWPRCHSRCRRRCHRRCRRRCCRRWRRCGCPRRRCWCWCSSRRRRCRRGTRRYLVVARDVSRRCRSAEVLGKEPSARVPLYARYPVLVCVVREVTDDHLELQVRIVLIQAYLVVLCRTVVGKEHRAPFDVEYTIRRAARYRGEDTAVSTGEARTAAQTEIGSLILPHRKDCEVIRPLIRWG